MTNDTSSPSFTCASCEATFDWPPMVHHGLVFCCAGCAAGGPCSCSYDRREDLLVQRAGLPDLPMTPAAWRSLTLEASQLALDLRTALERRSRELGTPDEDDVALPAWRIERAQQRLETLQGVLDRARVVAPDGRAVVGARLTLRDAAGALEWYALVPPGDGDATRNRVPADSSLGSLLLGQREGSAFALKTPTGVRRYAVTAVDYPEEPGVPSRRTLPLAREAASAPIVSSPEPAMAR